MVLFFMIRLLLEQLVESLSVLLEITQAEIDEFLAGNAAYVTPETGLVPQVGDEKTQEQARNVKFEPIFAEVGSGSILLWWCSRVCFSDR